MKWLLKFLVSITALTLWVLITHAIFGNYALLNIIGIAIAIVIFASVFSDKHEIKLD